MASYAGKWVCHQLIVSFLKVEIYRENPNARKLSLRFLAHHVLQEDIQSQTHDSIVDARTAVALYVRHLQLVKVRVLKVYSCGF